VLLKILSVNNHELWRLEDCLDRDGEGRLQNVREERAMLHRAELCENLAQGVERVGGASCIRLKQGPKDVNSIRRQMFFDDRDDSSQRIDCFGFKMTVHVRSGLAKGLGVQVLQRWVGVCVWLLSFGSCGRRESDGRNKGEGPFRMCEVDRNSVRKNAWQHAKLKEGVGAEANFAESYSTKSCEHTLEEFRLHRVGEPVWQKGLDHEAFDV
jgi:hypothetical protein